MNQKRVRILPCRLDGVARRWNSWPALFLLPILLAASPIWGQGNQGTLEGSVADPSGAAVAGAQLTVTNDATGLKFQTTTSSDGLFTFPRGCLSVPTQLQSSTLAFRNSPARRSN